jgi:hypothetical protein
MLWWIGSGLIAAWFVLRFVLQKHGLVHLLLLSGIAVLVVQIAAYRKTKYQKRNLR